MYNVIKLTVKNRLTIASGSVVDIEVNEEVSIDVEKLIFDSFGEQNGVIMPYGKFYLRKSIAKKGVVQMVHTPFPSGYKGIPLVVVKNEDVSPIELLAGEEIGELWVFLS